MDLLIKGLSLPKDRLLNLTISKEGNVLSIDAEGETDYHVLCAIDVPTHGNWHTGTPTEDGEYVCTIKIYPYEKTNKQPFLQDNLFFIKDGEITNCIIGEKFEIIRWQKIEPYKETN